MHDLSFEIEIAWADLYRSALARAVAAVAARNTGTFDDLPDEAPAIEWRAAA